MTGVGSEIDDLGKSCSEISKEEDFRSELIALKRQLEAFQHQLNRQDQSNTEEAVKIPSNTEMEAERVEFPPLIGNTTETTVPKPQLCLWKDKLEHGSRKTKEVDAVKKNNRAWIPKDIARLVHGAASISDLKEKLATEILPEHSSKEELAAAHSNTAVEVSDLSPTARIQEHQPSRSDFGTEDVFSDKPPDTAPRSAMGQQQCVEEGWTPVAPSKAARKVQHKGNLYTITHEHMEILQFDTQNMNVCERAAASNSNRDGTPPSPSPK
ncbi:unnamed protein product [Amaranthus hypochondriacus]